MTFPLNSTNLVSSMLPADAILEALIPGYGFFVHLIPSYFHVDISSYLLVLVASFAFWMYAVSSFSDRLQSFFLLLATSVEIRYNDSLYNDTMRWVSNQPSLNHTKRSVGSTRKNFATAMWDDDGYDDERDHSETDQLQFENDPRPFWIKWRNLEKVRAIRYTPAPAHIHYFRYKGCLIALRRQPYKDTGSLWVANMEKLYFYTAPWNGHILGDLLYNVQKDSADHDKNRIVVNRGLKLGSSFQWTCMASMKPRSLSTIVVDPEQKSKIINDVQDYLHPRTCSWYQSRGLPYRRGYLFYGPPGTGKSSLCFGIASLARLHIYTVSLSANDLDEDNLVLLFQSLPKRCIVLFEDVDQAGIQKRSTDSRLRRNQNGDKAEEICETDDHERRSNGITLSAFLNVIDGVSAQEGRILVMTTNRLDQIDGALQRPGRVDMRVLLGYADQWAVNEHFRIFYLNPAEDIAMEDPTGSMRPLSTPACPDWKLDDIEDLGVEFANKVPAGRYTAAEIQNYLLLHKNDPVSAVRDVTKWMGRHDCHLNLNCETENSASRVAGPSINSNFTAPPVTLE